MRWLSPLLFALQLCCSVRARGLADDFKQEMSENNINNDTSPGENIKEQSDEAVDVKSEKQNLNFIYQFLLGSSFGDMSKDIKDSESKDNIEANEVDVSNNEGNLAQTNSSKLLQPPEPGAYGRQNKVYWTDEELNAVEEKDNSEALARSELVEDGRAGRVVESLIENILPVVNNTRKLSRIYIDVSEAATEDTPAQDRQLAMSLTGPSLDFIEDIFQQMVLDLTNHIDRSREVIVEDIASNNMLGYTIVLTFVSGAALDNVRYFLVMEKSLAEIMTDKGFWFFLGYLWFYAVGFSGPWMFPATFNTGGDPNLLCSSVDFFSMMADSELNLNIKSISSRSKREMLILSERLRTDFNSRLGCIVHKKGDYKEAEQVYSEFKRLLGIINLHHQLTVPDQNQEEDIGVLDQELRRLWDFIPIMVPDVHGAVTERRANTLRISFLLGILNLLGAICGTLLNLISSTATLAGTTNTTAPPPPLPMFGIAIGLGYSASHLLFMEEADPGIDMEELDNVNRRYQGLASLQALLCSGQVREPALRNFVGDWRRELGATLYSLLSTEDGIRLGDTMDMFVNLANSRLDMTPSCESSFLAPPVGQRCSGRNYQDRGCCTPEHPCDEGMGDCDGPLDGGEHDGDAGCKGDLICGCNNCKQFGAYYHPKDDCCVKPPPGQHGYNTQTTARTVPPTTIPYDHEEGEGYHHITAEWGEWEPWSHCTLSCGGGTWSRSRFCTGTGCIHTTRSQDRFCNLQPCTKYPVHEDVAGQAPIHH